MVTLKGKQQKPGQPVDTVSIHPNNADLFLGMGYRYATKEDEAEHKEYIESKRKLAKDLGFTPI